MSVCSHLLSAIVGVNLWTPVLPTQGKCKAKASTDWRRLTQIGFLDERQFGGLPRNTLVIKATRKFTTEHTEHTEKFGVRKTLSLSVSRLAPGPGDNGTASSPAAFFSSPLPCVRW